MNLACSSKIHKPSIIIKNELIGKIKDSSKRFKDFKDLMSKENAQKRIYLAKD